MHCTDSSSIDLFDSMFLRKHSTSVTLLLMCLSTQRGKLQQALRGVTNIAGVAAFFLARAAREGERLHVSQYRISH
jgi:hypothetical protein